MAHEQKENKIQKKGFTLIELLVVIAIMALLLSILSPSLRKAKYQAQRSVCIGNVRQQIMIQLTYASDNGRFPIHMGCTPNFVQMGPGNSSWWAATKDTYVTNSKVLLCPILRKDGSLYADLEWEHPTFTTFGAWDSPSPQINVRQISYAWFANYAPTPDGINEGPITFLNGESHWPRKPEECTSLNVMVTHETYQDPTYHFFDHSHGGNPYAQTLNQSTAVDNPIGHGDGHVAVRLKSDQKPRASFSYIGRAFEYIY